MHAWCMFALHWIHQAYEGYALKGQKYESATGAPIECRFQEGMFAVGVWVFWLIFIAATIDRAPKHVSMLLTAMFVYYLSHLYVCVVLS